ncbi:hypothetical protein HO173_006970 [Letharia columbiana]|uniref:Uncharacterized protein n=1 Tax=Letharia columbiana TaxID=112416 RepID=A0A8H6L442_9LECA|nr:uncharacterized protein HO173_006970 [Letharia columbiana]KAF6234750.1 hypothetical protein HO173_006970 [Letharia columbiana]
MDELEQIILPPETAQPEDQEEADGRENYFHLYKSKSRHCMANCIWRINGLFMLAYDVITMTVEQTTHEIQRETGGFPHLFPFSIILGLIFVNSVKSIMPISNLCTKLEMISELRGFQIGQNHELVLVERQLLNLDAKFDVGKGPASMALPIEQV